AGRHRAGRGYRRARAPGCRLELAQHIAAIIDALPDLAGQALRHQRGRLVVHDVEDRGAVRACLPAMPRNPSVTNKLVLAPLPSSSALVPTVVPWQKYPISARAPAVAKSSPIPAEIAREGSSGVDGSLAIESSPVSSLR